MKYREFLESKAQIDANEGFAPLWMPDFLFDFQAALVEWAVVKGRGAIFADCGLGKSPMQLVWAENVVRHTNKPVLIATPLAVSYQLLREAEKFGVEAVRSIDGKVPSGARVVVTNYERLEHFDPADFAGMVCDESSILKNYGGVRRKLITGFMRKLRYRLLCTATAAPNDFIELGTSSEALGGLQHTEMLSRFFKKIDAKQIKRWSGGSGSRAEMYGVGGGWRFAGHAEEVFWKWVCSWARAVRKPSDLGFEDGRFQLPGLTEITHVIEPRRLPGGLLFPVHARGLSEQREERKRSLPERCEKVAELTAESDKALIWCQYNAEGDMLEEIIPDAVQVQGSDSDEKKEEALIAFAEGDLPKLVTKPKIGAFGLNLQRCAHVTFFPSHSYEQYYQGVRRCWRFGQDKPVQVDTVATPGEARVIDNLKRKSDQAGRMFEALVAQMNSAIHIDRTDLHTNKVEVPAWL